HLYLHSFPTRRSSDLEIAQLQAQISQLQSQLSGSLCLSGKTITIGELLDLTDGLSTQGVRAQEGSVIAINDINSFLATSGCNLKDRKSTRLNSSHVAI